VGGTFGSASKITGSLEDMVRSAAGLDNMLIGNDDIYRTSSGGFDLALDREKYTSSLTAGLRHGGDVFVNSVVTGFSGLYEGPVNGFSRYAWLNTATSLLVYHSSTSAVIPMLSLAEYCTPYNLCAHHFCYYQHRDGLGGACRGTLRGLVGLVAAPVTGALGAVSVVTESVRLSAQYRGHGRPVGKRRKQRRTSNIPFHTSSLSASQYSSSVGIASITDGPSESGGKTIGALGSNSTLTRVKEGDWSGALPQNY
jgi:hypothetical protein